MKEFSVRKTLQADYDRYYTGDETAWRTLVGREKANNIVALCGDVPHDSILDIGCGEGAVLERLSQLAFGKTYTGIEISASGVETTLKRAIPQLAECALFDGYTLPYPDQSFDVAALSHVVEHLEFPRRLLYEAGRVARHVFIEVPLEDNLQWHLLVEKHLASEQGGHAAGDPGKTLGHLEFFSRRSLRRLAITSGLDVVKQVVTNFPYPVYKHIHGKTALAIYPAKALTLRLAPWLARRLWTYNCAMLCKPRFCS
ncbi:MAG TPA: class I SAM-dependent methyltransferase [Candidatus Hydrogenedentes bacterium]|nr:class I SAM-dependent methyltransferase [Candidatus Hydrogenedentota bacterium]HOS02155.1 class I SAM-dependent methyltransferase [Candidatus Hydrogenedentota bacterium]